MAINGPPDVRSKFVPPWYCHRNKILEQKILEKRSNLNRTEKIYEWWWPLVWMEFGHYHIVVDERSTVLDESEDCKRHILSRSVRHSQAKLCKPVSRESVKKDPQYDQEISLMVHKNKEKNKNEWTGNANATVTSRSRARSTSLAYTACQARIPHSRNRCRCWSAEKIKRNMSHEIKHQW